MIVQPFSVAKKKRKKFVECFCLMLICMEFLIGKSGLSK